MPSSVRQSSRDDAGQAARTVEQLAEVIAGGNLAASDMTAAFSAGSSDALQAIEKEFRAAQAAGQVDPRHAAQESQPTALRDAALNLLALGEGKASVFKLRQKQLDANDYGELILQETGKLNVGLGISVQQLVDGVQKRPTLDLADAPRDFLRDPDHARARRPDPGRVRAVRLALCRPQHPAPARQPATLDAASVRRRS